MVEYRSVGAASPGRSASSPRGTVITRYFLAVAVVGFFFGFLFVDLQPREQFTNRSSAGLIGSAVADGLGPHLSEVRVSDGVRDNSIDGKRSICREPSIDLEGGVIEAPWFSASTSGVVIEPGALGAKVFFAEEWGAFTVAGSPTSIAGCSQIQFSLAASADNPTLVLHLTGAENESYGSVVVNQPEFVAKGKISSVPRKVTVPLRLFSVPEGNVAGISLVNESGVRDLSILIDRFEFLPDSALDTGSIVGQASADQSGATAPKTEDRPVDPSPLSATSSSRLDESGAVACQTIFDQNLSSEWHHASWGFSLSEVGSEARITFPNYWGALSFQSHGRPVDVSQCQDLRIQMSASADTSFVVQIQTVGATPAGEAVVEVGQNPEEVVIPLDTFGLIDSKVTRVSIVNQAEIEGIELTLIAAAFTD